MALPTLTWTAVGLEDQCGAGVQNLAYVPSVLR